MHAGFNPAMHLPIVFPFQSESCGDKSIIYKKYQILLTITIFML